MLRRGGHSSKANTVRMHSSTREARVLFEQELWGGDGAAALSPPVGLNRCHPVPGGMGGTRTLHQTQGAPKPKINIQVREGPAPGSSAGYKTASLSPVTQADLSSAYTPGERQDESCSLPRCRPQRSSGLALGKPSQGCVTSVGLAAGAVAGNVRTQTGTL